MLVQVIRSFSEMQQLASEWNALLESSASHVPFLRHEYQAGWWETLGGGEWPEGELSIVTARREDGLLAGIAPLFFTHNREGEPVLMLIGSIEISDYLDVIAPHEALEPFMGALLDTLCSPAVPHWQALDMYNIIESSPTLPALQAAAEQRGCRFLLEPLQHCPYIPLPGDWETYLAGIDKKQRHEIRRKMRRAAEYERPVRWYIVEEESRLDEEIDAFLDLMAYDPEKLDFLDRSDRMRDQMRQAARNAFREGWLQLAFMEVAGEKAAGYLNFDYQNHIWVYNSGLNPRFRELSLGWVLLGHLLQWANEHGRVRFDFMRGDEDYKYRFGGIDRRVVRATLRR
jgi:CelD/BcsL family acetyltransferase involved in cellulose biosynthesis